MSQATLLGEHIAVVDHRPHAGPTTDARIADAPAGVFRAGHAARLHERHPQAGVDLDRTGFVMLGKVAHAGSIRVSDLAEQMGLDISTVSRKAQQLEAAGLVERTGGPRIAGRRCSRSRWPASATTWGCLRRAPRAIGELTADWTPEERTQFADLLERFSQRMLNASGGNPLSARPPAQKVYTHRQILVILSGLMLGMLLAALDQTIVATALPTIVGDLGGLNHLSWVVTAYLLASTVTTPLYGKISDLYGRKCIFQVAIVIFLIGSALSGARAEHERADRVPGLQGLGAGGLMTLRHDDHRRHRPAP